MKMQSNQVALKAISRDDNENITEIKQTEIVRWQYMSTGVINIYLLHRKEKLFYIILVIWIIGRSGISFINKCIVLLYAVAVAVNTYWTWTIFVNEKWYKSFKQYIPWNMFWYITVAIVWLDVNVTLSTHYSSICFILNYAIQMPSHTMLLLLALFILYEADAGFLLLPLLLSLLLFLYYNAKNLNEWQSRLGPLLDTSNQTWPCVFQIQIYMNVSCASHHWLKIGQEYVFKFVCFITYISTLQKIT